VPVGCLNPRELPGEAGESQSDTRPREPAHLQGKSALNRKRTLCLPCRRSWVRIPSAALGKACICRPFSSQQSSCSSASGRTESGLAVRRSSGVPGKTPGLQDDSGSPEPKPLCGPAEGQVFGLLRPLPRLVLQRHDPAGEGPPARYPRWRSLGASPDSVRKPRGHLGPLRGNPSEPWHLGP
jgi:hypothetical protein